MNRNLLPLILMSVMACGGGPSGDRLVIAAAASTTDAVNEILTTWEAPAETSAQGTFASSSTLARQIEAGAPIHIFISANISWMDHLEERNLTAPGSRATLLTNRLVLVAPSDAADLPEGFLRQPELWAERLGDQRLSLGDPAHVPAGVYARAALEHLGVWEEVSDRIAPGMDVRGALALVERGESPLGIVYATDAQTSQKTKVLLTFPTDSHPDIAYPMAMIREHENAHVQSLFAHLTAPKSKHIWTEHGFMVK